MSVDRRNKPAITTIGTVDYIGTRIKLDGWGLDLCLRRCRCHINPSTHLPNLYHGANNSIGLRKFHPCYCCESWTQAELQAIARELAWLVAHDDLEGQTL